LLYDIPGSLDILYILKNLRSGKPARTRGDQRRMILIDEHVFFPDFFENQNIAEKSNENLQSLPDFFLLLSQKGREINQAERVLPGG
jgi:hypothetical protein